jgi:hypothetical protein
MTKHTERRNGKRLGSQEFECRLSFDALNESEGLDCFQTLLDFHASKCDIKVVWCIQGSSRLSEVHVGL